MTYSPYQVNVDPSNVKSANVAIAPLPPAPYNILFIPKVVTPVPPLETESVPASAFATLIFVIVEPLPLILVAVTVPVTVKTLVVPFHVNSGSSVIADVPLPINNRPTVKVVAPVPPPATPSVPVELIFKLVSLDPSPAIFKAVKILFVLSHVKFPDCVIADVPPINNLSAINELTPVPPKSTGTVPLTILLASNDDKPSPEP